MSEYNTYMNMAPANPAVAAVKKTGGSALFLIATITYTVMLLLSLISAFMPTAVPYADLLYEITGDYSVYYANSAASAGSIVGALIGAILTILIAVGLWMIYGASKSRKPRVSTGGFTMVNVIEIIFLVLISIALAIVCIIMVVGALAVHETMSYASSLSYYGFGGAESVVGVASTAFIVIFAFVILFCVLAIIYYAKLIGSIRVIKKAANGIVAGRKISLFVIVINFILIGFSVIGLIGNLIFFSFLSFLSSLLAITFNVLITIALIQMRGKLNRIVMENAMNNTMGGTGAYADYNTGAYENYNTGSYNNFNTGTVPPVQPQAPQYEQPQAQQYGQPQQGQPYGQPQQFGQQTGGYQYQQPQAPQYGQPQQYQQQAPQQNQQPWNGGQQ